LSGMNLSFDSYRDFSHGIGHMLQPESILISQLDMSINLAISTASRNYKLFSGPLQYPLIRRRQFPIRAFPHLRTLHQAFQRYQSILAFRRSLIKYIALLQRPRVFQSILLRHSLHQSTVRPQSRYNVERYRSHLHQLKFRLRLYENISTINIDGREIKLFLHFN
jgi:hypothetical protein